MADQTRVQRATWAESKFELACRSRHSVSRVRSKRRGIAVVVAVVVARALGSSRCARFESGRECRSRSGAVCGGAAAAASGTRINRQGSADSASASACAAVEAAALSEVISGRTRTAWRVFRCIGWDGASTALRASRQPHLEHGLSLILNLLSIRVLINKKIG